MDRRHFLMTTGAGLIGSSLAACGGGDPALESPIVNGVSAVKSRVIVIGGGMAGAAVAKYLRLWGDNIAVTLVERSSTYTSCIMSSLVLTGQRSMSSLAFKYDTLRTKYGITTVFGDVVEVDPVGVKVKLASGTVLTADRIVMAPGIEFDTVPGLGSSNLMPHAWKAGPQTTLLANQLKAMPSGGVAVLTIPKVPYRCPPGPYERACLLADWLKVKKPGSKLIVLDANPDFVTEKDNFSSAFLGLHGNVIEYHTNAEVTQVDPTTMTLLTTAGSIRGNVINMIPRQRAGALITSTGLANATEGRFAGVDVLSYASTVPGASKIHVIGDSSATTQPKAGHIANQEAKVCADAISRLLSGRAVDPAPVTNSACYSTITMSQASWLTAVFQYDAASATMKGVATASGASVGWNGDNFDEMGKWFSYLMGDTFA
jgi:NADH dehydrogenase FAD-containing subunit